MSSSQALQTRLENATRKWWFFIIIVFIQFIPPYTSSPYDYSKMQEVVYTILGSAWVSQVKWVISAYPAFKLLAIFMLIGLLIGRNRWSRAFSIYAALLYCVLAVVQSVSQTERFGLGIVINNLLMFFIVALAWGLEAFVGKTDYERWTLSTLRLWVLPAAFLAFWYPLNWKTGAPDFNPVYIFTSVAGIAFCLITPVFLSLLILSWPRVNLVTLRVTSLVGFVIGWYNMPANFAFNVSHNWWNGILHLPLLLISLYGLVLGYRRQSLAES